MFWKRIHTDPYAPFAPQWHDPDLEVDSSADREEELLAQDVRAYLAERFRLVFEFATLGAYDQDSSASPLESERKHSKEHRHSCAASRPRSATPGRNVAPTSAACTTRSEPNSCGVASDVVGPGRRRRDRSRRLAAKAPEQPCTWLG
jgi:hypothetical protein